MNEIRLFFGILAALFWVVVLATGIITLVVLEAFFMSPDPRQSAENHHVNKSHYK